MDPNSTIQTVENPDTVTPNTETRVVVPNNGTVFDADGVHTNVDLDNLTPLEGENLKEETVGGMAEREVEDNAKIGSDTEAVNNETRLDPNTGVIERVR